MPGWSRHSSSEGGRCGRREGNPPAEPIRWPFTYRKPYHSHLAGRECRSLARTHWHRLGCKTHRRTESGQRQAQVAAYRGRWGPGGASRKPCTRMAASFSTQHSARRSECAALESSCRVSYAFCSAVTERKNSLAPRHWPLKCKQNGLAVSSVVVGFGITVCSFHSGPRTSPPTAPELRSGPCRAGEAKAGSTYDSSTQWPR